MLWYVWYVKIFPPPPPHTHTHTWAAVVYVYTQSVNTQTRQVDKPLSKVSWV